MISETNFPPYLVPFSCCQAQQQLRALPGLTQVPSAPRRQLELDQPLPVLAIFTVQITFPFCTAFLLEKWRAGVGCWSTCNRLLHFRPLPQHWFQTFKNPEIKSFWVCPSKWNEMQNVFSVLVLGDACVPFRFLCGASRVRLLSASPSASLLFWFIWKCCQ